MPSEPIRLGFIPANRAVFSSELAADMRARIIDVVAELNIDVVVPSPTETEVGCVGNITEAEFAAKMFREADVQGIIIGAVNFGDEQAAAWAVRESRLDVPVMVFGSPENEALTVSTERRDSFCGLLSIGDALRQTGTKYSVAPVPMAFPEDTAFKDGIDWFARVCNIVHHVRRARYAQIGARPDAFWTCRFDEKQLQRLGPTTVTLDLSEVIGGAGRIDDDDPELQQTIDSIRGYADTSALRDLSVIRSAKLELFIRRWGKENKINAYAIQCWTSLQENYGVCSCTTMSRLGDEMMPAACEADILGTLSMHALQLASHSPAALADWNNLHNDDDELANLWHCGVFPAAFTADKPKLMTHPIMNDGGGVPEEECQGIVHLKAKASPVTLARVTQEDGKWKVLIAEGNIEDNPAETIGSYGWCRIEHLQHLYRNVLLKNFPHHVALTQGNHGNVLWEAFGNYLEFETYNATQQNPGVYTPALPFN